MTDGLVKLIEEEPASELVTTDTCQDDEIEPLSGKPYFHIILCKTHVGPPYQLAITTEFTRSLPNKAVPVTVTRGNRSWEMTYMGNLSSHKRFDPPSWKDFATDNSLKVGDICIFELMTNSDTALKFKVQVLQGDFPSILLKRNDGSEDNPIVVE